MSSKPREAKPKRRGLTKAKRPAKSNGAAPHGKRLRPGELDGIVLSQMRKHQDDLPLTASAIAKATGKSGGAIANCLARLVIGKEVRLAKQSPRAYDLEGITGTGKGTGAA